MISTKICFLKFQRCTVLLLFLQLLVLNSFCQQVGDAGDSVTVAIAPQYDSVRSFHRFLFGESYRKLWAAPVKIKVFNISKEKGGLTILQRGGGLQTKSLRLKDAAGREWVLRSIQKYPERGLPVKLRATVAKDILQDQVVTGHPYSALTVPPLAAALGIPHSNPQIVYIPDDPALGEYRGDFAHSVLLFEEREPDDTLHTDNSEKAQRKLQGDNDVSVDQKLVLRARILDIFLGDWDRHEDQWRWEVKKANNEIVYTPVPRDRDKVYYNTSGVLPFLLSRQWLKSNLQGFNEEIRDIKGYNFNNRYFDRYFLNRLSEAEWREQIAYVKSRMTDSLIKNSISLLPDTIYALSGERIINTLIARRDILEKECLKYYWFLSIYVDIPVSDKHEIFDINFKTNGHVAVTINKTRRDLIKDRVIYQRDFDPQLTKEIRLYGNAGNDVFNVYGTGVTSIKVRMIGGDDVDSFFVEKRVNNKKNLFVYDRSDQQNILPPQSLATRRLATDSTVNEHNKRSFIYDRLSPVGSVFFNRDQGLLLRAGLIYEKHGFRREPFSARHLFYANYATTWKSFLFTYAGDFTRLIGKSDVSIDVISKGPFNISNFFGTGNETVFEKKDRTSIEFFRNHYDQVNADVRIHNKVSKAFKLNAGVAAEFYTSSYSDNNSRFLNAYNSIHPNEKVFTDQFFAGLVAGAVLNTRPDGIMPGKGVYWNTQLTAMQQFNGRKISYGKVLSEFNFFIPVTDSVIVIANRLGGGTTIGEPAFYQQLQLGGPVNLRGYNISRFTGRSMFYHNIELRLKLFDFNSYIFPGTFGLVGFHDVGRVWTPNEKSTLWHRGYGGGFYLIPADLLMVQALLGHSNEGNQVYISVGLRL